MPRFQKKPDHLKAPPKPTVRDKYHIRWCIVCSTEFQPRRHDQIYCSTPNQIDCKMWLLEMQKTQSIRFIRALDRQSWTCAFCGVPGLRAPAEVSKRRTLLAVSETRSPVSLVMLLLNPKRAWLESHDDYTDQHVVAVCHPCRRDHYVELAQNKDATCED